MFTLAALIDSLEVILPLAAVLGVAIFFLVTKFGRNVMNESHQKGQQAGAEFGQKLAERLTGKKPLKK